MKRKLDLVNSSPMNLGCFLRCKQRLVQVAVELIAIGLLTNSKITFLGFQESPMLHVGEFSSYPSQRDTNDWGLKTVDCFYRAANWEHLGLLDNVKAFTELTFQPAAFGVLSSVP